MIVPFPLFGSPFALATDAQSAAEKLYILGLLHGTGDNLDGTPNFSLSSKLSREQAITLVVNLLGKADEARAKNWDIPFTDLSTGAMPFVGYAYANRLTAGKSATLFRKTQPEITASEYITFLLRILGYDPSADFQWNRAWELSDELGLTHGEYTLGNAKAILTRAGAASLSYDVLSICFKSSNHYLYESLLEAGVFTQTDAERAGLIMTILPTEEPASE